MHPIPPVPVEPQQPLAAVSALATDVADVVSGHETMVARAEDDLRPFVERLLVLHRGHLPGLSGLVGRLGGDPDAQGSLMGSVHKAVATVRDWAGALDLSALPAILDGEDVILQRYDEAIAVLGTDPDGAALLAEQRRALQSHVEAMRT